MPITFRPSPGDVLLCDYGGDPNDAATYPIEAPAMLFPPPGRGRMLVSAPPSLSVVPEMFKVRRVVVLSTNRAADLVIVAPFSTQEPVPTLGYHHFIPHGKYRFFTADSWLKGDMVMAVSPHRLDRIAVNGMRGRTPLDRADLEAVQAAVLDALGLKRLIPHLNPPPPPPPPAAPGPDAAAGGENP